MSRSELNQQSIDRLQASVDTLEAFLASGGKVDASNLKNVMADSDELEALKAENADLKRTQDRVKKRLDRVISNIQRHAETE